MIVKAIRRAYQVMEERNWDTIYWAIDLHGVCLKSNYEQGGYEWINASALQGLKTISNRPESKIILWSSVHPEEKMSIARFFGKAGISIYGFNSNIFERNTQVSNFDQKFYFSVLLDDKAGFDPLTDWDAIIRHFAIKDLKMSASKRLTINDNEKQVVHYVGEAKFMGVGNRAYLDEIVDHPRLGHNFDVSTSAAISYDPATGILETLNTIYKPVQQLNG